MEPNYFAAVVKIKHISHKLIYLGNLGHITLKPRLWYQLCHDPNPGVMTGAKERELLYPEPVASLKNKTSNATHIHKNINFLKISLYITYSSQNK